MRDITSPSNLLCPRHTASAICANLRPPDQAAASFQLVESGRRTRDDEQSSTGRQEGFAAFESKSKETPGRWAKVEASFTHARTHVDASICPHIDRPPPLRPNERPSPTYRAPTLPPHDHRPRLLSLDPLLPYPQPYYSGYRLPSPGRHHTSGAENRGARTHTHLCPEPASKLGTGNQDLDRLGLGLGRAQPKAGILIRRAGECRLTSRRKDWRDSERELRAAGSPQRCSRYHWDL
ncbi:hypothetical protein C8Q73DRAFT_195205 [Cubamyces lactineus]|nr:hypothetical protein C8Q73DRAFT_195205 [Cubamyces lactineus]